MRTLLLCLGLLGVSSPFLAPAPVQAQAAQPAGRIIVRNQTNTQITITCLHYLDAFGRRQTAKGGAATLARGNWYLDDQKVPFHASYFEYTLGTPEGTTNWFIRASRNADVEIVFNDAFLAQHRNRIPGRVVVARPPLNPPVNPPKGPSEEAMQKALGKVALAALTHGAAARRKPKDFAEKIAVELAKKLRDGLVESALKDLFPSQPGIVLNAATRVIGLHLDGELTLRSFAAETAKEELRNHLRRHSPEAANATEILEFLYRVTQQRR